MREGTEAGDHCRGYPERIGLILMDMRMPVVDGIEATRRIRCHERDSGRTPTPIIVLTAIAFEEDRQACFDAGCTQYMTTPVKKKALIKEINAYG